MVRQARRKARDAVEEYDGPGTHRSVDFAAGLSFGRSSDGDGLSAKSPLHRARVCLNTFVVGR